MNTYHIREKVLQLNEEVNSIETQVKDLLHELQSKCSHPVEHIVESSFKRGTFFDQSELRLCSYCGLQEEGWTYKHLDVPWKQKDHIRKVSRDELYKLRSAILNGTRVGIDEDDKPQKKAPQ